MIKISPPAAARLRALIDGEPDAERLGIRIAAITTGCNSSSFSIAISERNHNEQMLVVEGIRLFYRDQDIALLDGVTIDVNRQTGRFSIFHPQPPQAGCLNSFSSTENKRR
jgi:Fe-S cluster assembly iron-binding protein IscA